ncbi:hypothetical protein CC86DRAFT_460118 [Ophiobolus disseminans]|uniref:RNA-dependent RNA polymerase n=1 Tax=Ophiobolus disseminans TaxID=1469910 RepID=A0A6A6ZGA2_9PLEO|nr:hypothetical protein CC86DRAFT_460118 [Ophiobolus disseminans]
MIYPSHNELRGPVDPGISLITARYREWIGYFLRVKFVDNNTKPLKAEDEVSIDALVENRVVWTLRSESHPLCPIRQFFEFFGYSISSLKKDKAVWFFYGREGSSALTASSIGNQIGDWNVKSNTKSAFLYRYKDPSKWGARLSLAFTISNPVVNLQRIEWTWRDDEPNTDFPNTDGCGLISEDLCSEINRALALLGIKNSRAFQIRFGGVKGVVYAGPESFLVHNSAQWKMLLRESQVKFTLPASQSDTLELRILSTAGDQHQSLFFDSALKAFEDSGADVAKIERIFTDSYNYLLTGRTESLEMLQQMFRVSDDDTELGMKARYCFLRLAIRLRDLRVYPPDYPESFSTRYIIELSERARKKSMFNIPIPGSYCVLGLTDDYQVLHENEVFVQAQGSTIEGSVLIYRDPIIHIGDIQPASALSQDDVRNHRQQGGMNHDDVKSLAPWLSIAVDYAKSGKKVDLMKDVRNDLRYEILRKPDSIRALSRKAFHDPTANYYESNKLLGRIYRRITDMKPNCPQIIDNTSFQQRIKHVWTSSDRRYARLKEDINSTFETFILDQFRGYNSYASTQLISGRSEVYQGDRNGVVYA